ncbi:MAG: chalcone isomerase family protein [Candidatus Latescibacteria bacterium]|nr:chalcone isomerase family protein [Candidatus Latescibacterota bacterium]
MKQVMLLLFVCLLAVYPGSVSGREVKGVDFPETTSIDGTTCKLNGVGLRKKLVISVYLGGLYLQNPTQDAEEIIASDQIKQIVQHFLYSEVRADQMIEAWNEGFEKNSPDKITDLKDKIDRFNGFFTESIKKGEKMVITYRPGKGTEVTIRGKAVGIIEGKDFMEALFSIWFGPSPPSKGLKEGMLGE